MRAFMQKGQAFFTYMVPGIRIDVMVALGVRAFVCTMFVVSFVLSCAFVC